MAQSPTRRGLLRAVGGAATAGLAGCTRRRDGFGKLSVTPAPVPSDGPTSATPTRGPALSRADLELRVRVRSGFDETGPARLEIALRNAGDTLLTVLDGPRQTVPFVDDDSVGTDWSGDPAVLLVPDGSDLTVDPADGEPAPIGEFLPDASPDGCWTVPFDWPAARGPTSAVLHAVPLQPGERRRHGYSLYSLEGCATGTFSFENSFDLAAGDPPFGRDLVRARLGFDLAISETMAPVVRVHDLAFETSAGDG